MKKHNYKFCPACGNMLTGEEAFCGKCGKSLDNSSDSASAQVQTKASPPKEPKDHKSSGRKTIVIVIGAIIVAFFLLIGASVMLTDSGNSSEEYAEQTAGEENETEIEETEANAEEIMEAYKAECQNFDYREYFRYEQEHIGEKIKLEMLVDQVIDGDFRGYDAQGNEYYIIDEREEESSVRVMEGDILTVYGEYSGVAEVTRALGDYESEVFCITAKYVDFAGEESETSGTNYISLSDYVGSWQDEYSQRCGMEITALSESEVSVFIHWASGASENTQWTMTGVYQPDSGTLEYTDCVLTDVVYQDNGAISSKEAYSGGTGRFYIEEGYLYWVDDMENQGAQCYFQRIDEIVEDTQTNAPIYQTMYVVNCNESITLRTSPSTQAAEICQIPLGAAVSYIESAANGFYKVAYLGQTGYALASYLEFAHTD